MTERPIRDELRSPLDDEALDRVWDRLDRCRRPALTLALATGAVGAVGAIVWLLWPAPPVAGPIIGSRPAPAVARPPAAAARSAASAASTAAEPAPSPPPVAPSDGIDLTPARRDGRRAVTAPDGIDAPSPAPDGIDRAPNPSTDAIGGAPDPASDANDGTPGPASDAIAAALGHVERGDSTAALVALRARPPVPTARALLAEHPALAAALLDDALDRGHPPGPAIDVLLADAYAAAGDRRRAARAARRALRAAPGGPDAPRMRRLALGDR